MIFVLVLRIVWWGTAGFAPKFGVAPVGRGACEASAAQRKEATANRERVDDTASTQQALHPTSTVTTVSVSAVSTSTRVTYLYG